MPRITVTEAKHVLDVLNLQWNGTESKVQLDMPDGTYRSMNASELQLGPAHYKFSDVDEVSEIFIYNIEWRNRKGIDYAYVTFVTTGEVMKALKALRFERYAQNFDSHFMVKC